MIKTRLATINDAEKILNVYAPYVKGTAISFEYAVPSVDEFQHRICKTLAEYPYLVAVDNDAIVGYAYAGPFHPRAAFKYSAEVSIYIDRNYHGLGLGKRLYSELERILSKQNIFTVCACIATTDRCDDPYLDDNSVRFHESMGYRTVGEHRLCGYKFDRWYHVIWMEKELGVKPEKPGTFIPFSALDIKPKTFYQAYTHVV